MLQKFRMQYEIYMYYFLCKLISHNWSSQFNSLHHWTKSYAQKFGSVRFSKQKSEVQFGSGSAKNSWFGCFLVYTLMIKFMVNLYSHWSRQMRFCRPLWPRRCRFLYHPHPHHPKLAVSWKFGCKLFYLFFNNHCLHYIAIAFDMTNQRFSNPCLYEMKNIMNIMKR